MSVPIRKAIRVALVAALSDVTDGFNAKLAALAVGYGITAFTFDWTASSDNFAQVQLDPEDVEAFHSFLVPPFCLIYTSEAVNLPDEGVKYQTFSGQVLAHVEVLLRYRSIKDSDTVFADTNDMESLPDAVEDALFECIHSQRADLNTSGFHWTRRFTSSRDPVQITGDGHFQRVAFAFEFERHV